MRVLTKKHIVRIASGLTAAAVLFAGIASISGDTSRTMRSLVTDSTVQSTTSTLGSTTTTAPAPTTTVRVASSTLKAPNPRTYAALIALTAKYRWSERSAAVKQLQSVLKVVQDGVYGPQTRKAHINALKWLGAPAADVPTPPAGTAPSVGNGCPQWLDTARSAGWAEEDLARLTRVMWRESRCNPQAHNGTGPDDSYGLLQVNVKGYLWKGRAQMCGLSERSDLFDPATNLRCALVLWQRSGWRPWGF